MKKAQQNKREAPFTTDSNHIYDLLINHGISEVDLGWGKFTFELHANITHDNVECDGLTEFATRTIKLDCFLEDAEARETILHELMHCMAETVGLHERMFNGNSIKTTNEFIVSTMAKQFLLVKKLNPALMSLLFS